MIYFSLSRRVTGKFVERAFQANKMESKRIIVGEKFMENDE